MKRRPRYQFSIRWLFVLTTVVAVVAAMASRIQAPQFARTIIGVYFMVWSIYLAFHLKRMFHVFATRRDRLEEIQKRRQAACISRPPRVK